MQLYPFSILPNISQIQDYTRKFDELQEQVAFVTDTEQVEKVARGINILEDKT